MYVFVNGGWGEAAGGASRRETGRSLRVVGRRAAGDERGRAKMIEDQRWREQWSEGVRISGLSTADGAGAVGLMIAG